MLVGGAAVAIYTAAYMAEIVRGALKAVPAGQWEAASALGLKSLRRFRLVMRVGTTLRNNPAIPIDNADRRLLETHIQSNVVFDRCSPFIGFHQRATILSGGAATPASCMGSMSLS